MKNIERTVMLALALPWICLQLYLLLNNEWQAFLVNLFLVAGVFIFAGITAWDCTKDSRAELKKKKSIQFFGSRNGDGVKHS